MKNKICLTLLLIAGIKFVCGQQTSKTAAEKKYEVPQLNGAFVHIFNPNESRSKEDTTWYTNDHCFIRGGNGVWHAYGIIGHRPIDPWKGENRFFHITANSLKQQKWIDQGDAMVAKQGAERVLWAPHVIKDKKTYYLFYNTGNMQKDAPTTPSWGQFCLAKSRDLDHWKRHLLNPLFSDFGHARDSYIMKYNFI